MIISIKGENMSKKRTGWVSNSSSSSFIIQDKYISQYQKDLLLDPKGKLKEVCWNRWENLDYFEKEEDYDDVFDNYIAKIRDDLYLEDLDGWDVVEDDYHISFSTYMDNFDYLYYIGLIGIPEKYVKDIEND